MCAPTYLPALSQGCRTDEWARSGERALESLMKGPPGRRRILNVLYYCHCWYVFFDHPGVSPPSVSGERLCLTVPCPECHQKGSCPQMCGINKRVFNRGFQRCSGLAPVSWSLCLCEARLSQAHFISTTGTEGCTCCARNAY